MQHWSRLFLFYLQVGDWTSTCTRLYNYMWFCVLQVKLCRDSTNRKVGVQYSPHLWVGRCWVWAASNGRLAGCLACLWTTLADMHGGRPLYWYTILLNVLSNFHPKKKRILPMFTNNSMNVGSLHRQVVASIKRWTLSDGCNLACVAFFWTTLADMHDGRSFYWYTIELFLNSVRDLVGSWLFCTFHIH